MWSVPFYDQLSAQGSGSALAKHGPQIRAAVAWKRWLYGENLQAVDRYRGISYLSDLSSAVLRLPWQRKVQAPKKSKSFRAWSCCCFFYMFSFLSKTVSLCHHAQFILPEVKQSYGPGFFLCLCCLSAVGWTNGMQGHWALGQLLCSLQFASLWHKSKIEHTLCFCVSVRTCWTTANRPSALAVTSSWWNIN